jgi:hypothetical protein
MTAADGRAYVVADNRLAELAGWDRVTLAIALQFLQHVTVRQSWGNRVFVGRNRRDPQWGLRKDTHTTRWPSTKEKREYKHPPVKSRFRKGKSGNPLGRKKDQRNMAAVINEVLQQAVTVKPGDRSKRLTKGETLIKVLWARLTIAIGEPLMSAPVTFFKSRGHSDVGRQQVSSFHKCMRQTNLIVIWMYFSVAALSRT